MNLPPGIPHIKHSGALISGFKRWKFAAWLHRMVNTIHLHEEDVDEREISLVAGRPFCYCNGLGRGSGCVLSTGAHRPDTPLSARPPAFFSRIRAGRAAARSSDDAHAGLCWLAGGLELAVSFWLSSSGIWRVGYLVLRLSGLIERVARFVIGLGHPLPDPGPLVGPGAGSAERCRVDGYARRCHHPIRSLATIASLDGELVWGNAGLVQLYRGYTERFRGRPSRCSRGPTSLV